MSHVQYTMYTRCTYLQCMPCTCILLTFEPTVSRRGTSTVGHMQGSVRSVNSASASSVSYYRRSCSACSLADLRGWSAFLKTAMHFLCFASRSSSLSHSSIRTSRGGGCIWTLSRCFRFRASLLPLSSSLSSQISAILTSQQ